MFRNIIQKKSKKQISQNNFAKNFLLSRRCEKQKQKRVTPKSVLKSLNIHRNFSQKFSHENSLKSGQKNQPIFLKTKENKTEKF